MHESRVCFPSEGVEHEQIVAGAASFVHQSFRAGRGGAPDWLVSFL